MDMIFSTFLRGYDQHGMDIHERIMHAWKDLARHGWFNRVCSYYKLALQSGMLYCSPRPRPLLSILCRAGIASYLGSYRIGSEMMYDARHVRIERCFWTLSVGGNVCILDDLMNLIYLKDLCCLKGFQLLSMNNLFFSPFSGRCCQRSSFPIGSSGR